MKKILILGGSGFLGKTIFEAFNSQDTGKYQLTSESRRSGIDLTKAGNMTLALDRNNPDIVINAAANVGSIKYVSEKSADVVVDNSLMYLNIYNEIGTWKGKKPLVINIISNCSYPGDAFLQKENDWWNGEVHHSVMSYGIPKKLGYIVSRCFEKQHNIKTMNLIVSNAYGPGDYTDEEKTHAMNGIILRMIKSMIKGEKEFTIWGSGSPIREWIYMPDAGRIIHHIIDNQIFDLPNPINIAQNSGISIKDSAYLIKEALNYKVDIKFDLSKQDGAPVKILDDELFKLHFPNFVFTDYEEGIKNTISYYSDKISSIR